MSQQFNDWIEDEIEKGLTDMNVFISPEIHMLSEEELKQAIMDFENAPVSKKIDWKIK